MPRRRVIVGALAAAACIVVAVIAVVVVVPKWRAGAVVAAPPAAPIAATLRVLSPAMAPGETAELLATAISATPISRLQLFSGGEAAAEITVTGQDHRAAERLQWTPPTAGSHLLVLRAVDEQGRVAHAAPLWLRVDAPPLTPPAALAAGGQGGGQNMAGGLSTAAAEPQVRVQVDGCVARISGESAMDSAAVALYGLGPGQAGFQPLRLGDTGQSEATMPLVSGELAVYALEYGGQTNSASPITFVRAPQECASGRWKGDVSIVDGILHAPGAPSLAYLYLSVDGGGWQRVPPKDQTFVRQRGGRLDFSRVLPPLDGAQRIEVQAWTRDAEGAKRLGSGSLIATPGEMMPILIGLLPGTDLDLVEKLPLVDSQQVGETLTRHAELHAYVAQTATSTAGPVVPGAGPKLAFQFRWQPKLPAITHGVWQLSMVPLGSSPTVDDLGVLAYGTVPVTQKDFDIDFRPLVMPEEKPPTTVQVVDYSQLAPQIYTEAKAAGGTGNPPTGAMQKAPIGNFVAISPPAMTTSQLIRLLKPSKLYVRIVPMAGEQPVDAVSNPVTFTLFLKDPTPPALKKPPAIGVQVEFDRPYLPDHNLADCVRVVANPFGSANPPPFPQLAHVYGPAPVGATLCPYYPSPDNGGFDLIEFFEDAFNVAVDFWDTLVAAYAYLKSQVVKLIVTVSGCGKGPTSFLSEQDCTKIAALAVDVTLMAFGIPPDLPSSQELMALAKGELVDGVYALAAANGISCDVLEEQCKEMMNKVLDEVLVRAEEEVSKATKNSVSSGGGVLYINPHIKVIPEPRGRLQPALFKVTYTRLSASDEALPAECLTTAHVYGRRENWEWYDYDAKKKTSGTVDGFVFMGANSTPVNFKALAQGQSVTRIVVLGTPSKWFEPGADPYFGENDGTPGYVQVHSDPSHYWVLMRGGSTLTARLGGCAGDLVVDSWTTSDQGWQG